MEEPHTPQPSQATMAAAYPPIAAAWINPVVPKPDCLKSFLRSGEYSDMAIRCGDRTWTVHKVIVCSQCEFLQNACSKGFQEEESGIIKLDHDPENAVEAMLEWAYSGNYSQPTTEDEKTKRLLDWLLLNTQVFILAEKYLMKDLKNLAWINIIMWTDKYTVDSVEEANKFTEIAATTYAGTPDSDHPLRGFLMRHALKNIKRLLLCNEFQDLLKSGSEFSVDLVSHLANRVEACDPTADSSDADLVTDKHSESTPSESDA